MKVILKENELWNNNPNFLNTATTGMVFVTEHGDFVASIKRGSKLTGGLPIIKLNKLYTRQYYVNNGVRVPDNYKSMQTILFTDRKNSIKY